MSDDALSPTPVASADPVQLQNIRLALVRAQRFYPGNTWSQNYARDVARLLGWFAPAPSSVESSAIQDVGEQDRDNVCFLCGEVFGNVAPAQTKGVV